MYSTYILYSAIPHMRLRKIKHRVDPAVFQLCFNIWRACLLNNNLGAHCRVRLDPGEEGRRRRRRFATMPFYLCPGLSPLSHHVSSPCPRATAKTYRIASNVEFPAAVPEQHQSNSGVVRGGKKASPCVSKSVLMGWDAAPPGQQPKARPHVSPVESVALWVRTVQYGQYSSHLYSTVRFVR